MPKPQQKQLNGVGAFNIVRVPSEASRKSLGFITELPTAFPDVWIKPRNVGHLALTLASRQEVQATRQADLVFKGVSAASMVRRQLLSYLLPSAYKQKVLTLPVHGVTISEGPDGRDNLAVVLDDPAGELAAELTATRGKLVVPETAFVPDPTKLLLATVALDSIKTEDELIAWTAERVAPDITFRPPYAG